MTSEVTGIEIILGTYEEFLLGYKYFPKSQEIKQTFATHSHCGSIRSVTQLGGFLASGGSDDRIFVYDLKQRKEHCILTHHTATVQCLQFTPEHTHILSGSADGILAIVRVGNWQLEKTWDKAHKGTPVLDIAVHESGKLALTLGANQTLCTWNLIKGRQAYVINLTTKSKDAKSLERVIWCPDGVRFVLYGGKYTEIWSIELGGLLTAVEHTNKVTSCCWLSKNKLLVGHENGKLSTVNVKNGKIKCHDGHSSRIKSTAVFEDYIVTAASGGDVKVWDKSLQKLQECNTGCRITCLCLAPIIETDVKEVKVEESKNESDMEENSNDELKEESETEVIIIVPKKKTKKIKNA